MNRYFKIVVLMLVANTCFAQSLPIGIPKDEEIEDAVEYKLKNMTLDEKIGQMTEISIDVLGEWIDGEFFLNDDKLFNAIANYKVGSVLNAPGPIAQSRDKWKELIGKIQDLSIKEIGIPCIYGLDQNHGTTYTLGGTLFPQNINIAASFSGKYI